MSASVKALAQRHPWQLGRALDHRRNSTRQLLFAAFSLRCHAGYWRALRSAGLAALLSALPTKPRS